MEEEKEIKKKKESNARKVYFSVKIVKEIIYIIIICAIALLLYSKFNKKKVEFFSASNLIKVDEVEKFLLARFNWDGIAEHYKEDSKTKEKVVDMHIRYQAEITATMNMDNFNNNVLVDKENKKIYLTLPKIELKPTIIFKDDGTSFSFIPSNAKVELRELVTICEDDAVKKVSERVQLFNIAKENAKKTIEGMLLPLIEEEHYIVIWKDGE